MGDNILSAMSAVYGERRIAVAGDPWQIGTLTRSKRLARMRSLEVISMVHAEAVQRLASDPEVAATTRLPHPYPAGGAEKFIAAQLADGKDGKSHVFAILDDEDVVGVCGIHGIAGNVAQEMGYWIGRPFWGQGYATFGVGALLDHSFRTLRLGVVKATALESNLASRRVLEKSGFSFLGYVAHQDPALKRPEERLASYEIRRSTWQLLRYAPILAGLNPALKEILDLELAAGNEIIETSLDWPEMGSVLIRLRNPFVRRPVSMPEGVSYLEPNDPHWWHAEYSTRNPAHILAC